MCERICGNCMHWDAENGINMPNPRKEFRAVVPHIRYGMCNHPGAELTDMVHMLPLTDADFTCDQLHKGFSATLEAYNAERDYRATYPGTYLGAPIRAAL